MDRETHGHEDLNARLMPRYDHGDEGCEHGDMSVRMEYIRTGVESVKDGHTTYRVASLRESAQWECDICGARLFGPLNAWETEGLDIVEAVSVADLLPLA